MDHRVIAIPVPVQVLYKHTVRRKTVSTVRTQYVRTAGTVLLIQLFVSYCEKVFL